ncbi:mechanosensitive ion channel family protein [Celeribacter halophilus]|uniref:Small-conductance mechanosensitive channel n=1 Tax=Celeribacter halophilus TaxID=576117 RepID=A0A1I3X6P4_9RHOB|nr:mechanosensitive ion channel family protein [Celeribacter halophilus]PZX04027.1 small-conductance mechanosensitive channel [Celeribacter halophilus]SFK15224.1 Small-conductance mechanosensitive channel [Celeribacter halophilus]
MNTKFHARRLVWPTVFSILCAGLILFSSHIAVLVGTDDTLSTSITALAYFAFAWLASRMVSAALDAASPRNRPYPRLLRDLIAALLFLVAFGAAISLFLGQGAIGALAGSGLVLAMLGFAIRNVVADTLSGIALGVEGPFRIEDWIDIDSLARGKVIEIGWRTTRILTRDSTYAIIPNSQIARQRITNYSAPRPQYRAQIAITLDHTMPVGRAREVMLNALKDAKLIQQDPAPDVRVLAYEEAGITYALRFWLSRFDLDPDCRDEVYSLVDDALRDKGYLAPHRRIELVRAKPSSF